MRLTRAVFIRCIGGIFLLAFLSATSQMRGLYGSDGISPISLLLAPAHGHPGLEHLLSYPSVFWFDSSDSFLVFVPLVGAFFSLLALMGILTGPCIFVSWFLYLSIVTVGQEFMSFQWDILLLETGFLCVFLGSWRPFDFLYTLFGRSISSNENIEGSSRLEAGALELAAQQVDGVGASANGTELASCDATTDQLNGTERQKSKLPAWTFDRVAPSPAMIWLCRWLLFRLMFQSGLCKLESGDQNWRNLTAMTYHYESQPLPTPLGWFAHQLPEPVLLLSTALVFLIEGFLPLLIFAGRRARVAVAIGTVFLQILILLTGNYCFFNLLTIALCLVLIDDPMLCRLARIKKKAASRIAKIPVASANALRNFVIVPVTILIVLLSTSRTLFSVARSDFLLNSFSLVTDVCQPWHLVSSYGLFAVMTTSRPEIAIEGSLDGKTWKEYIFKYKPGPLDRAPPIVAPHQPRLDWQMWFAALGTVVDNQWLVNFAERLLEGSPDVLGLLQSDPFNGQKPKYIRASIYDYHMEDIGTLLSTGRWWKREYVGVYLPAITKVTETLPEI